MVKIFDIVIFIRIIFPSIMNKVNQTEKLINPYILVLSLLMWYTD